MVSDVCYVRGEVVAGPNPQMIYRQRIARALDYIRAHLDEPIRLADVARAAAFSEYHFHRIFRAVMDETVGRYITRKRMETAALMLAYHADRTVTEIGFACGYSSTANFSRAFSTYFGVSPSALRRRGAVVGDDTVSVLARRYGKDFSPADLFLAPALEDDLGGGVAGDGVKIHVTRRAAQPVVCMTTDRGYDPADVVALWRELIARARQLGLCGEDVDAHGVVHDDPAVTAEDRCRYDACIRVSPPPRTLPPPLFASTLPAGRYASFRRRGHVRQVPRWYREIYALWFPSSSLAPGGFPPIERYLSDEPDAQGHVELEILIAVRPLEAR